MSAELRACLAPYESQRVRVEGYYSTMRVGELPHIKQACIEDVRVWTADGKDFYIGHTWVQKANPIVNDRPLRGSRVRFDAYVRSYRRRMDVPNKDGLLRETAWGLSSPENVEVEHRQGQPPAVAPPVVCLPSPAKALAAPQPSPVALVREVRELTTGIDPDALVKVLPHLDRITEAVRRCGSAADLLDLLDAIG